VCVHVCVYGLWRSNWADRDQSYVQNSYDRLKYNTYWLRFDVRQTSCSRPVDWLLTTGRSIRDLEVTWSHPMCGWVPPVSRFMLSLSEFPDPKSLQSLIHLACRCAYLYRPLLPCPSRWHSSTAWSSCDGWLVSYTAALPCFGGSGLPAAKESLTSSFTPFPAELPAYYISPIHVNWGSSCKGQQQQQQHFTRQYAKSRHSRSCG